MKKAEKILDMTRSATNKKITKSKENKQDIRCRTTQCAPLIY